MKKTKKKTKKKVKKKTKKKRKVRRIDPHQLLMEKIDRIRERVPYIEPSGEETDPDTNETLFHYTEAQKIFKLYREECEAEGLHFRSYADEHIKPMVVPIGNMPCLIGYFCIEDIKTGARIIGWGCGMGRNLDWSANTAGTRALKQFLLMTFEPTWEDPEDANKVSETELRQQVRNELIADGTLSAIDQLKDYFSKPKGDANGTKRQNPTNRTRRRS